MQSHFRSPNAIKFLIFFCLLFLLLGLAGCASTTASSSQPAASQPAPTPKAETYTPPPPSLLELSAALDTPRFSHLPPEKGLSQSVVQEFLQDAQGFLWLGTQDGLNRYDGSEFKIFKNESSMDPSANGLRGSNVTALLQDPDGYIWIGTSNGGLNRYDPASGNFTYYPHDPANPNSPAENAVTALDLDPAGFLWIATSNQGLDRLDLKTGAFAHYRNEPADPSSLSTNSLSSLERDRSGNLWVGTLGGGLNRLDSASGRFTRFIPNEDDPTSLGDNSIQSLYLDRQGTLWVGTFSRGLHRYEASQGTFTRFQNDPADPQSLAHNSVSAMYEDGRGNFWIATQGSGLNRLDRLTGKFSIFRHNGLLAESLSNDILLDIYEDRSGVLWLGSFGTGADFYDPYQNKFLVVRSDPTDPNNLSQDSIWSVEQDGQGILWVATYGGGLNRFDPKTGEWRHYVHDPADPDSLISDFIFSFHRDASGLFWLGTDAGFAIFDPATEKWRSFPGPFAFNILQDRRGQVWVATGLGLARYDPAADPDLAVPIIFTNSADDPGSLSAGGASILLEDRDGSLWVGTYSGGLNHFDPQTGKFTRFGADPARPGSLSNNSIISLYQGRDGTLWVGTADGLNRFDPASQSFRVYTELNGLADDMVYCIQEDGQERLWLSTNKGLSRFSPRTLEVRNYRLTDGLQASEFNQFACSQNAEGVMFFGGVKGLNIFHPGSLPDNPYIPPVVLTGFKLYNRTVPVEPDSLLTQPVEATQELVLSYRDDFFEFSYAALQFSSPDQVQYAYRLEPFDADWNYVGNRRFANYTNVPPGEYTFRVKASNGDGAWNEEGTSLSITIPPPFWQTAWFRVLAVMLLAGTVGGSFYLRLRASEQQRRHLESLVEQRTAQLQQTLLELEHSKDAAEAANQAKSVFLANMSHEFRTPLNAILGFTQVMRRDRSLSSEQRENLAVIHRSGDHLLGLINDVLEMSKIEAGGAALVPRAFDLPRLLQGLQEMFALRAEEKGLALELELGSDLPPYVRGDEGKLRQVLMNLLGNAVKFTRQGQISLAARLETPAAELQPGVAQVQFTVEDTGPGIAPEEMDRLFIPFVQTQTGRQTQGGTGLGLPISQKYVHLMGGEIRASSQPGRGSAFRFTIPLEIAHETDLETPPTGRRVTGIAPGADGKVPAIRMLVVDDQEINRRLLQKLFEPVGFEVRQAANGQEALETWRDWEPHLVWMDMRMPVMDGYEATRRIKSSTRGMATVVIALTASALEEDRLVILSEGCDDYVRKPFREEELFQVAARHLGIAYLYETADEQAPASSITEPAGEVKTAATGVPANLPSRLAAQAPEWLSLLERAALVGDLEATRSLAESVRSQDTALADELLRLSSLFEHDLILQAIQQAGAHTDEPTQAP